MNILRFNFRTKARGLRIASAAIFLCCGFVSVSQASQNPAGGDPAPLSQENSITSLTQQLGQISASLGNNPTSAEFASLNESLPKRWTIATPERQYTVTTDYLRAQLAAGSRENAKVWVDHLAQELGSYPLTGPSSKTSPRAELAHILAGSEFAAVHPPTAWDLLRQRIAEWIGKILGRILGGLARYPIGGQILFWIVVVAGVGFVGLLALPVRGQQGPHGNLAPRANRSEFAHLAGMDPRSAGSCEPGRLPRSRPFGILGGNHANGKSWRAA